MPRALRQELDRRLIEHDFRVLADLIEWLASKGWELSKGQLADRSKKLGLTVKRDIKPATVAKAKAQLINELAGEILYDLLRHIRSQLDTANIGDEEANSTVEKLIDSLSKASRALAAINASDLAVSKYASDAAARAATLAESLKSEGDKKGIDAEFMNRIKSEVLGLF